MNNVSDEQAENINSPLLPVLAVKTRPNHIWDQPLFILQNAEMAKEATSAIYRIKSNLSHLGYPVSISMPMNNLSNAASKNELLKGHVKSDSPKKILKPREKIFSRELSEDLRAFKLKNSLYLKNRNEFQDINIKITRMKSKYNNFTKTHIEVRGNDAPFFAQSTKQKINKNSLASKSALKLPKIPHNHLNKSLNILREN